MANPASAPHNIRFLRPAPCLEPFVRCYGQRDARIIDTVVVHPVHARAAPVLDFEFGDGIEFACSDGRPPFTSPTAALVGIPTQRRGQLHICGTVDSFVVLFQPAALHSLFSLPAHEFTDRGFESPSVLGPTISRLQQRLADCRSFEERASIANQFLLHQALAAGALDGVSVAANQIVSGAGAARIPAMADSAGLSLRQFERRFVQQVGITPKLFARIARFEAALDLMARSPGASWTDVAHRFGYYDQMHMVHEFAEFTSETPTNTLRNLESVFQDQMTAIRSSCHSLAHCSDPRLIL